MDKDIKRVGGPSHALQPSKGGRPSKLIPEVQARVVAAIRAGHYREPAARLAGISPATLYRWMNADSEPYLGFQAAIETAEAELEREVLEIVTERIPDDPRLALAFLAKRFPSRWGTGGPAPTARTEPPTSEQPRQVNVLILDREELEDAARQHLDAHRQRLAEPERSADHPDDGHEARGDRS